MTSVALQVLQKLDRGLITVDEAEQLLLTGWSAIYGRVNKENMARRPIVELPTPAVMTLPTMFGGESSTLWM